MFFFPSRIFVNSLGYSNKVCVIKQIQRVASKESRFKVYNKSSISLSVISIKLSSESISQYIWKTDLKQCNVQLTTLQNMPQTLQTALKTI